MSEAIASVTTDREEDYLKAIYILAHGQATPLAPGLLVERLGVSSAAVSRMLQRLDRSGLVRHVAYQGVTLTEAGRRHALRVLRHHRLVEYFLVERLGYDWAYVDESVDRLEHAIDEELAGRLEAMLGHPPACPHGDPIPSAALEMPQIVERPLNTLAVGQRAEISRVMGDAATLTYLREEQLVPGTSLTVTERSARGGLLTIERDGERLLLPPMIAAAIFVRRPTSTEAADSRAHHGAVQSVPL
ncbi:MAG: metal-dependent transcriptional regulator [Anaerolineales bacterium]|nr:metal-dependent transcriptional regulator [Anaerolineales bacterium]MCB9126774.1 metal-dependent transcriptional regulator [Ardenticatenales bacterium]MCB9172633.1 metal-dependent transcriptional regulator [Ardenticatenales bacterium]